MAKLTSPSQLNVATEIVIDEPNRTVRLVAVGNLVAKDGVTLQAVYSKLVQLWNTSTYQDSPFPMNCIDALSGQFQIGVDANGFFNGWKWFDDTTRNMLRDGGWSEYSNAGVLNRQYGGFIGLGAVNSGSQPYYQLTSSAAPVNFPFADQFNVGVQVYGDATNGNFDTRTYAKAFIREYSYKYRSSVLADTGATGTGAFKTNFLISNESDPKIQANDAAMTGAPYSDITVGYYTTNQNRTIGGTAYPFRIIIAGNNATAEQIYTKIQYLLRQNSNINATGDAGSVTGKTAADLLRFDGDTLVTSTSVYIDNFNSNDTNRIQFYDQNGVLRTFPYVAAGSLTFNAPLIGAGSSYRLFFKDPPGAGNDYGEAGAITVNDASGVPITGTISSGSISFTFDYDGNTQGGYSAGTDRNVVLVGVRPGYGTYTVANGIISRSKGLSFGLVSAQERNYVA
jgi:hypothetical protein